MRKFYFDYGFSSWLDREMVGKKYFVVRINNDNKERIYPETPEEMASLLRERYSTNEWKTDGLFGPFVR